MLNENGDSSQRVVLHGGEVCCHKKGQMSALGTPKFTEADTVVALGDGSTKAGQLFEKTSYLWWGDLNFG